MKNKDHTPPAPDSAPSGSPLASGRTSGESVRHGLVLAGLILIVLIAISSLFAIFDLDRLISAQFYDPDEKWAMGKDWLWTRLYRYGTIPGALLGMGCLVAWLITFFNRRWENWRPYFLLVALTTIIAAGILVNGVFKPYWGRPRPNQTTDFGGYYTYRHVFPPGIPGKGASFPCGHCTMGFTILSLYFAKRRSKRIAYGGAAVGLSMGILLSAARIVNGAHFTTDAIWSFGIVLITMVLLYYCILKIPVERKKEKVSRLTKGRKLILTTAVCIVMLIMAGAFMTRRPFFKTIEYPIPRDTRATRIEIKINIDPEKLLVKFDNRSKPALLIHAHGFGWADADYQVQTHRRVLEDRLFWQFQVKARSYFSELDHTLEVVLPEERRDKVEIVLVPNHEADASEGVE